MEGHATEYAEKYKSEYCIINVDQVLQISHRGHYKTKYIDYIHSQLKCLLYVSDLGDKG